MFSDFTFALESDVHPATRPPGHICKRETRTGSVPPLQKLGLKAVPGFAEIQRQSGTVSIDSVSGVLIILHDI